jgi:hypothetical protein
LEERDFQISQAGKAIGGSVRLGKKPHDIIVPGMLIPPGQTAVQFSTSSPLRDAGNGDTRLLGFRIYGIQIEVHDGSAATHAGGQP